MTKLYERLSPAKISVWQEEADQYHSPGLWVVWIPHIAHHDEYCETCGDFYFERYTDAIEFASKSAKERFPLWYEK